MRTWPQLASISFFPFRPLLKISNFQKPCGSSFYTTWYFSAPAASIFLHLGISVNFKGWEQSAQGEEKKKTYNLGSELGAVIDNLNPTAGSASITYIVHFPSTLLRFRLHFNLSHPKG